MSAYARFFIHFAPHPISFIHSFLFLSDLSLRIIYPFCSPPHGISHPVTVIATRACSVRGTCPYRLRVQRKASGGARGPFSFHIKIKKASGRAYALTLFSAPRAQLSICLPRKPDTACASLRSVSPAAKQGNETRIRKTDITGIVHEYAFFQKSMVILPENQQQNYTYLTKKKRKI